MRTNIKHYGIVYKITNLIDGFSYIGQTTKSISHRVKQHLNPKNGSFRINHALNKYGLSNFKVEIIDFAINQKDLDNKEIFHIKYFNTLSPNGYNLTTGGRFRSEFSEETKQKLSKMFSGNKSSSARSVVAINIKTGQLKRYDYQLEAEKDGFIQANISACCRNITKKHKNHFWVYESEYTEKTYEIKLIDLQIKKERTKSKNKTSNFKGVFYDKDRKHWRSFLRFNNKLTYLGVFNTEVEAKLARDHFIQSNQLVKMEGGYSNKSSYI